MDKELPIGSVISMAALARSTLESRRANTVLLLTFAAVALLLATLGVYGVMTHSVTRRIHEIGIRIALGAHRRQVLAMVLSEAMVLALCGVSVGLAGAWIGARFMRNLLAGVSSTDPATFIGVAFLLTAVALSAAFVPARRAARIDPMVALRYE